MTNPPVSSFLGKIMQMRSSRIQEKNEIGRKRRKETRSCLRILTWVETPLKGMRPLFNHLKCSRIKIYKVIRSTDWLTKNPKTAITP